MIENLKELLGSSDEEFVKQGIELILNLGMEEELYFGFKDLLEDSDLSAVEPELKFLGLFQDGDYKSSAQVCLLSLVKVLNVSRQLTNRLILKSNPYFEEFDLLNGCFDGVDDLALHGFEWQQIKQILESNPQVKKLKLSGRPMIDWSEGVKIFRKQLDYLSLDWVDLKAVFHKDQSDVLLPLLEKGMEGMMIHKEEEIESLLKKSEIDLGDEKNRWLRILQRMALDLSREVNGVSFDLVYCPAGRSKLGDEDIEFEIPKRFWMGQTQVTQELWKAVMGNNPSYFKGTQRPVEGVSWFDCIRFCNKLSELEGLQRAYSIGGGDKPNVEWNKDANGYRLPSEHEWEMAARAGTDFEYAGSDNLNEVGWYGAWCGGNVANKQTKTQPVAQKKPNRWGLYDMSGNVEEQCNNPYFHGTEDPYAYRPDSVLRSLRGGSWSCDAVQCRVSSRSGGSSSSTGNGSSLRLLRYFDEKEESN